MNKVVIFLCILGMSGQIALADGGRMKSMKMPTLTAEQRQKMADAHEQMAVCLRSDKAISVCHEDMMKSCKEGMGKDGCPMMGAMGKHHGHMGMGHADESASH